MTKYTVLIAEDDENYSQQLAEVLRGEDYGVLIARDGSEAIKIFENHSIDLGLVDLAMPGVDGMGILKFAMDNHFRIPLIMITGHASIERAVAATKMGAYDFMEKPVSLDRLLISVQRALEKSTLERRSRWMAEDLLQRYKMVGSSPAMIQLYERIDKIAPAECSVLITGETGTGKELAAMAIHLQSQRRNNPFIKVNCAALPSELIESELFGHRRGAFTGAIENKPGKFDAAHRGSLFLDEIGDMSLAAQSKILRTLQEKEIEPVGSHHSHSVDVRIVAATNRDLHQQMGDHLFRLDLYYRLSTIEIHIPPLRERIEDIVPLANHFLKRFCQENNRLINGFKSGALQHLINYDWPGNVRQLKSLVERACLFTTTDTISEKKVVEMMPAQDEEQDDIETGNFSTYKTAKENFERKFLKRALIAHRWNISETAQDLQMDRTNLYKKIKQLEIHPPERLE